MIEEPLQVKSYNTLIGRYCNILDELDAWPNSWIRLPRKGGNSESKPPKWILILPFITVKFLIRRHIRRSLLRLKKYFSVDFVRQCGVACDPAHADASGKQVSRINTLLERTPAVKLSK